MICTCPECKNEISLKDDSETKVGLIIECAVCGVTLEIKDIAHNQVIIEIVDEGK